MTVQVSADPALAPVPASQASAVVGQRAATDMAAGTLLTREQVSDTVLPAAGMSIVGVGLPSAQLPGEPLLVGDRVRVVATPGASGEVTAGEPVTIAATVVGVRVNDENGQSVVSVQVPQGDAAELAARAATGTLRWSWTRGSGDGADRADVRGRVPGGDHHRAGAGPDLAPAGAARRGRPDRRVGSAGGVLPRADRPDPDLDRPGVRAPGGRPGRGDPVGVDADPGHQRADDRGHPVPRSGPVADRAVGTAGGGPEAAGRRRSGRHRRRRPARPGRGPRTAGLRRGPVPAGDPHRPGRPVRGALVGGHAARRVRAAGRRVRGGAADRGAGPPLPGAGGRQGAGAAGPGVGGLGRTSSGGVLPRRAQPARVRPWPAAAVTARRRGRGPGQHRPCGRPDHRSRARVGGRQVGRGWLRRAGRTA